MEISYPKTITDKIKNQHNKTLEDFANLLKVRLEDFSQRKILNLEKFENFECESIYVYARKKESPNPICEIIFKAKRKDCDAEKGICVKTYIRDCLEIIFNAEELTRDDTKYHFLECNTINGLHERLGLPRFYKEIEMADKLKEIVRDLEDLATIIY